MLFLSKLLLGLSIGLSTAIPPLYVTENAPANLRSTASSLTNVTIVLGFFVSSLTGYGASKIDGVWSYKLAFCMTFLVPAIYACGLPFFPESPVWYMKKGTSLTHLPTSSAPFSGLETPSQISSSQFDVELQRLEPKLNLIVLLGREENARRSCLRLFGKDSDIDGRIEMMRLELKKGEDSAHDSKFSQTSWRAIFSKEHRARTFVAVLGLQSQNFSGGYFANTYQTYYFE